MSLNDSVISGKCPACLIYEEKVARLEEKLEAVSVFVHRMMGWGGEHRPHPGACDHCAVDRILKGGE